MIDPETGHALCRFCFYGAAIALFGSGCFLALLSSPRLGREIGAAWNATFRLAGLIALLASLAALPCIAATIGDDWSAALDRQTLVALMETTTGRAWLIQSILALLMLVALFARPALDKVQTILAALLLLTLTLSGHAQMDQGALRALHIVNHGLHLLAGGFWLGSLTVLPACLARLRNPTLRGDAASALRRFSSLGHAAVALVIATGLVNSALILRRWPNGAASLYQLLLLTKIALVAVMTGIALVNRYGFVPRMRTRPDGAIAAIRRGTVAELALGAGVLALVAVFGLLDPA